MRVQNVVKQELRETQGMGKHTEESMLKEEIFAPFDQKF